MNRDALRPEASTKILIVEDSRTQAEILRTTLETYGYDPVIAGNGKEALALLETMVPDLIISDVIMPVMDGYEFCRTVKNDKRFCNVPLILLTMLTDSRDVIYAMVSGADNFITKPYQGEYLVGRVKKVLAQQQGKAGQSSDSSDNDIFLSGKRFTIRHTRQQIIEFLLSAYEAAVIQHQEVLTAHKHLSEANDEVNLYLDIITHDINNVNTGALALTELLLQKSDDKGKPVAKRLVSSINQSSEIIANVSTIRKMHERRETLRAVNLSEVIRSEILRFPTGQIHSAETDVQVMADTLLSQVFTNLIGNSVKFAGSDAEVVIDVEDRVDHVEVRVTDNGPGIPDDMKPVIFDRFRKGKSTRSGKGLGLFIARALVESYGGTIRAQDRIRGEPGKGAAICFTLKKAS